MDRRKCSLAIFKPDIISRSIRASPPVQQQKHCAVWSSFRTDTVLAAGVAYGGSELQVDRAFCGQNPQLAHLHQVQCSSTADLSHHGSQRETTLSPGLLLVTGAVAEARKKRTCSIGSSSSSRTAVFHPHLPMTAGLLLHAMRCDRCRICLIIRAIVDIAVYS